MTTQETDDIIGWACGLGMALEQDDKEEAANCVRQIMEALNAIIEGWELSVRTPPVVKK